VRKSSVSVVKFMITHLFSLLYSYFQFIFDIAVEIFVYKKSSDECNNAECCAICTYQSYAYWTVHHLDI